MVVMQRTANPRTPVGVPVGMRTPVHVSRNLASV